MKTIHSIVQLLVLKTVIAEPQSVPNQQTTTTTTNVEQTSDDPSGAAIPQSNGLAPAKINIKDVGFTDTNRGTIALLSDLVTTFFYSRL